MNIGDHVICVNAAGLDITDFEPCLPVKGGHYVIREIFPGDNEDPHEGLMLVGIFGIIGPMGECCFCSSRFRLLEELKAENRLKAGQEAGI